MSKIDTTRRGLLSAGAAGLVSSVAVASVASAPARASTDCGGMTRAEYETYVKQFNENDPGFIEYYHPDVVFELGTTQIKTPQAIREFYADVKAHIKETVEVTHFVSDATGVAAELPTEFKVYKDWENGFFQRPLKAGMVMRTISFGLYWVENGKFRHIKSARYKQIHDWRMES